MVSGQHELVLTQAKTTTPRDPNKFPTAQLFLLGEYSSIGGSTLPRRIALADRPTNAALVRVAEPIALTSIFPYAWRLVLDFHVGDRANASFYAGILISAFALAESVTGM